MWQPGKWQRPGCTLDWYTDERGLAVAKLPSTQREAASRRYPEREGGGMDLDEKSLKPYLSAIDTQQIFTATVCQANRSDAKGVAV